MQKSDGGVLYSASDLVNYLECEHLTALDLINLDTPLLRTEDSEEAKLIQAKGYAHEADFLEQLRARHKSVIDIAETKGPTAQKVAATGQAMRDGYEIIFQATLQDGSLIGHADFLRKVARPSNLGDWSYEVLDTKLSRSAKAKFIIQLAFYSAMVAKIQGLAPLLMHVILGDRSEATYRYADYSRYLRRVLQRFMVRVQNGPQDTYPIPCEKCDQCKWSGRCEDQRLQDDHLSQVANISRLQIRKLEMAGVKTLEALASLPEGTRIQKMSPETLLKLHHQARLQFLARQTGERHLELLPEVEGEIRGFARLPQPTSGDLFFDMEGNPLEEGGLEYLFGLYFFQDGKPEFKAFWAHSRQAEKLAFEAFMDFVTGWLGQHPGAHIYHYAHYEQTALKKLMSLHGTREAEVDTKDDRRYPAIEGILTQSLPVIRGCDVGSPIVVEANDSLPKIIAAISNLDSSYVFVQGPPGAGKTYTGSHVIVSLLQQGFTVGVSSNSHKAINNLLHGIEELAQKKGFSFRGAKKSTAAKSESCLDGEIIEDVFNNTDIWECLEGEGALQLVAGTAWLFSDAAMDQTLDYIFVDEAGQVALANLVAMGTSARNVVLLGDQMQLGQPIQGVHPGRSGESSLEYLLNGMATIPPERGIFLDKTWRMHPDVCQFISEAVYDGRLDPEPNNANQMILLGPNAHPLLKPTGIRYIASDHDACSQRSEEEAELVLELVNSLLKQRYRDKNGDEHPVTLNDILVVAPYNMQVNLLKKILPDGVRVGTVDKFQGQEAPVVIVSMATSSGDYLPRFIEFLYSKNRLNVAISRAKSLALFIANPALMAIRCSTPEEMALVNTLCWVQEEGS